MSLICHNIQHNVYANFFDVNLLFYLPYATSTVSSKVQHTEIDTNGVYQKYVGVCTKYSQHAKHSIGRNNNDSTNYKSIIALCLAAATFTKVWFKWRLSNLSLHHETLTIAYTIFFPYYRERSDLQHTVQVMADLGLTYVQTKNADGTYQYQVEPDISYLFNFKGILHVFVSMLNLL